MAVLGRTFDAVVLGWHGTAVRDRRADASALRRRVEALCAYGVQVGVLGQVPVAEVDRQLRAHPGGPGRLLVAVEGTGRLSVVDQRGARPLPRRTGSTDAVAALLDAFAERGVGPGLTLLVGAGPTAVPRLTVVAAGPRAVLTLLDEQLRRRRTGRVPSVDEDPEWTLTLDGSDPLRARAHETLLTLGDGVIGVRGSHEEGDHEVPLVLAAGVYAGDGPGEHLLAGPSPLSLAIRPGDAPVRRVLDLRTGVLLRDEPGTAGVRTLRFVAAGRHGVVGLRAEGPAGRLRPGPALSPTTQRPMTRGATADVPWARTAGERGGIAAAVAESVGTTDGRRLVERLAAYAPDARRPPPTGQALAALARVRTQGFDALLAQHRARWARRWADACVAIPDDLQAQRAARFALFALWCSVAEHGEAAVGARGLTGTGYAGHVFWDADVFVLPAVVSTAPAAARAMLEYRLRRLPQARALARLRGLDGARFPWESASLGLDVTPTSGRLNGEWVPILTGQLEEHVTADVAWAANHYAAWTGDTAFLTGPGRPLVTDTARYWASRAHVDPDGRAHLRHVIGPDEYHEDVDDNAYTNVMARWNLRRGAALEGPTEEARSWLRLAEALVDGYDPTTGRHEQFTGYDRLEPLVVADIGSPPLAADLLLGPARTAASQLVKQPDILMAHHLVPEELPPGSLTADLDFSLPRTAHGSSLSPAVTAALLARARRPDEALTLLDVALRLDLDDLTGMTGAGLHLATLGGVWQALLLGFAGVRVVDGVLVLDPCLPARWSSLVLRFRCLRRRVELRVGRTQTELVLSGPLRVRGRGGPPVEVTGRVRLVPHDDGWVVRS